MHPLNFTLDVSTDYPTHQDSFEGSFCHPVCLQHLLTWSVSLYIFMSNHAYMSL